MLRHRMMIEVTKENWVNIVAETEQFSLYIDPVFLEPVARQLCFDLRFYVKYHQEQPVMGFAVFVKGNKIKVPTHFIYSGIWWNVRYETIKFRNYLIDSITALKKLHNTIELRLPPCITDIRPFQWQGFTYKVNYTYIRSTSDLNFEYNIRSRVKKSKEKGIACMKGDSFDEVWKHQIFDLKRFSFTDDSLTKLRELYREWWTAGSLLVYKAEQDGIIIGSSCVLIDADQKKACNLLISSANSNYDLGVHAALYNFIFHHLAENNIREFDLYGADLRGVADFKSSFDAKLTAHYIVRYNRASSWITKQLIRAKQGLIRAKNRFI